MTAFVDREAELDRLCRDLLDGQKVFLISPRRYGKSSLIRHALRSCERDGALAVEVTVSSYSSYVGFLEGYARRSCGGDPARPRALPGSAICSAACSRRSAFGRARSRSSFPQVRTARDVSRISRPRSSSCPRESRATAAAADGRARRVPGDRRRSTAAASSTRCAPPFRGSARSATCSPAPSRRSWSGCSGGAARSTRRVR